MLIVVVPPTQRPARNVTSSPFGRGAKRSGQKRSCAAFDSQRVKSAARRCGPHSSKQHVAAALRELARDDAPTGAGPHDDDVESVLHAIPRYDQSFARRVAMRRVEVDLGPRSRPFLPRRDEVRVVRLDRERTDEAELRCLDVLGERVRALQGGGGERVDRRERAGLHLGRHPGDQRVDIDDRPDPARTRGRSARRAPRRPRHDSRRGFGGL